MASPGSNHTIISHACFPVEYSLLPSIYLVLASNVPLLYTIIALNVWASQGAQW